MVVDNFSKPSPILCVCGDVSPCSIPRDHPMSVPVSLVQESKGCTVSVELENGETYTGTLVNADDALNLTLSDATCVDRKGRSSAAGTTFLRGSMMTLFRFPKELPLEATVAKAAATVAKARGLEPHKQQSAKKTSDKRSRDEHE